MTPAPGLPVRHLRGSELAGATWQSATGQGPAPRRARERARAPRPGDVAGHGWPPQSARRRAGVRERPTPPATRRSPVGRQPSREGRAREAAHPGLVAHRGWPQRRRLPRPLGFALCARFSAHIAQFLALFARFRPGSLA
jgi:hypothetical protein